MIGTNESTAFPVAKGFMGVDVSEALVYIDAIRNQTGGTDALTRSLAFVTFPQQHRRPAFLASLYVAIDQFVDPWRRQFHARVGGLVGDHVRNPVREQAFVSVLEVLRCRLARCADAS